MVTKELEEEPYFDRMESRTRHNSVTRRKKTRRNNELKMRRSMSCDELGIYRNISLSPVWFKDLNNMRSVRNISQRTSQKEKKKTNKNQIETKKKRRCLKNNSNMIVEKTIHHSEPNSKKATLTKKKIDFPTNSLLHYAVSEGDIELVQRLIIVDSNNIDKLSIEGTAPIHEAAINGDLCSIRLLLKYGASLETVDRWNRTAVEYAVLAGHFDCAALLLSLGANDEKIRNGVPLA